MGALCILGMVFLLFNSVLPSQTPVSVLQEVDSLPVLIAHRGAKSHAPENTAAAVEAAIDIGVRWVEVDVHRSLDDVLIVMHDRSVHRTTDGRGRVANLTWCQIQELDAGSWFSADFAGEPVPRLADVLETAAGRANMLVELKARGLAFPVAQMIQDLQVADTTAVQSFSADCVREFKRYMPSIPAYLLIHTPKHGRDDERAAAWMVGTAQAANADGIGLHHRYVTSALRDLTTEQGLVLFAWTVNSPTRYAELAGLGVDAVVTDRPKLLSLLASGPQTSDFGRRPSEPQLDGVRRKHP